MLRLHFNKTEENEDVKWTFISCYVLFLVISYSHLFSFSIRVMHVTWGSSIIGEGLTQHSSNPRPCAQSRLTQCACTHLGRRSKRVRSSRSLPATQVLQDKPELHENLSQNIENRKMCIHFMVKVKRTCNQALQ